MKRTKVTRVTINIALIILALGWAAPTIILSLSCAGMFGDSASACIALSAYERLFEAASESIAEHTP